MPGAFENRVAVVTGAGRGIGRATALLFAAQGARVVVNDLGASLDGAGSDASPAQQVVQEIREAGGEAIASLDSVAEWTSAERIIDSAIEAYGRIDILINNAGLSATSSILDHDPELFDRVVRSHLHGAFHCIKAAAPHMKAAGYGRIINLVSRAGLIGVPNQAAYGAGKGGVFGLTNVVSRDLEPFGITVNAINPAATETRMVTTAIEAFRAQGGEQSKMAKGLAEALQPPENIAALIVALAAESSAPFNGEIFYLDKERLGLFDPLTIVQEVKRPTTANVDAMIDALSQLNPHRAEVPYQPGPADNSDA